jgi:hypothetical protein
MFYTADEKPLLLGNSFRNQSCFLLCGGPSLNLLNLSLLRKPGIVTFGINNSPKIFRPDMWTLVDDVGNFIISVWLDPKIRKFVPSGKQEHNLFDNTSWKDSPIKVKNCPNVTYYKRNDKFTPDTYLSEDTVNWGNSRENGGCRSVMLAAIKIIYLLGFNKLFILGADFKMTPDYKYAFSQDRTNGSIHNNNSTFNILNKRFDILRPLFEKAGLFVFNATPNSNLNSFTKIDFTDAVAMTTHTFPDTSTEKTDGLYDRQAKLRDTEFKKTHGIIYYNAGFKYLVRLAVSISSLRKVYDGQITILCDNSSAAECAAIASHFNADVKEINFPTETRNTLLFNKTLLHNYTPYKSTLYLDADTLLIKDPHKILKHIDDNDFVSTVFADWTPQTPIIKKRIEEWKDITDITKALSYPYAINTGVFAFNKKSKLMRDWYTLASKGESFFIPDEISCQIMLPDYKHFAEGASYNTSCKYGTIHRRTAIIHYHGNKHCRTENGVQLFNSNLWINEFKLLRNLDFIERNIVFDKTLSSNIGAF